MNLHHHLKRLSERTAPAAFSVPRLLGVLAAWCMAAPAWLMGFDLALTLGEHPVPWFVITQFAVWHLAWWLTVSYWVARRWYWSLWGLSVVSTLLWIVLLPGWAMAASSMHCLLLIVTLDVLLARAEQWFKQRGGR